MTQLGAREKQPQPREYKGFHLVRAHGRVYGIPDFLEVEEITRWGRLATHPAVLSASTREDLEARIDAWDASAHQPEWLDRCGEYTLVRHRGNVYGVPSTAGAVDLDLEEERRRAGVVCGATREEVEERIRAGARAVPVEFAGWLPVFEAWGNCGRHPQFTHTAVPPAGYRFTCSSSTMKELTGWRRGLGQAFQWLAQAFRRLGMILRPVVGMFRGNAQVGPRARLRLLGVMLRLCCLLLWKGARLVPVLRFLRTRHYQSQLLLAHNRGLVFLTSMPYTFGQNPWVIEIEDITTLFYPFVQNGHTSALCLTSTPYFPIIKAFLEADQCRGILTHMKSTARMIPTLFNSDKIRAKVHYAPLGVKVPDRWQQHQETEEIHLVFINSWCQIPDNFYVRGGLDVLEAFDILHERYPQLRLTLRTNLPTLDGHFHRIMEKGWVRVIHRFLPAEEMKDLLANSHIFLLPAARIHVVSVLQAMSYGLAVVASDGWGIEEYVTHEHNGLIVKGRYGKVSWADDREGMLREDYEPMLTADPEVVAGLVEAVSRLVEDRALRQRLGRTARRDVETTYNLEQWNRGLKELLDNAQGGGPTPEISTATRSAEEGDLCDEEANGPPARVW